MPSRRPAVRWVLVTATLLLGLWPSAASASAACETVGAWLDPKTGAILPAPPLADLARRKIVLLGENHENAEHHRWQLHTLAGLYAYRPDMVVGFEMFPRAAQPALDTWSRGDSSESEFLEATRWRQVWGYDADLYLPLFHFVRQSRLAMVALNVDRQLVARVGEVGWQAVPDDMKEGVSDPAPAVPAYRRALAEIYREAHLTTPSATPEETEPASDDVARFVEAQLTWDRAMAQALAEARRQAPEALVVGILGRGHVEQGHGVPHQLADLGEADVAVLLAVEAGADCDALDPGIADAVFLVAPVVSAEPAAKPRLGVRIEQAEDGVRVVEVSAGSVAEAAGLAAGDVIRSAAAVPLARRAQLIEIVQRQAPGTWLPLEIARDGETLEIVAKFPAHFE